MANDRHQQITQSESRHSFFSRLKGMAEWIIETVLKFFKKNKERIQIPPGVRERLKNNYREKPELAVTNQQCEAVNQQIVDEMKNFFHSQDPGEYMVSLGSMEEKQKLIMEFTQRLFEIYGLTDIKVVCEYMDASCAGFYHPSTKTLHLNMSFLTLDDPLLERDAIDTILHETRHAVQFAAIEGYNPLGFDHSTIREWVLNWKNYIRFQDDPVGYQNQPLEADAWSTAEYTMYSYLESIK